MTNINIHWTVVYARIYLLNFKRIYYVALRIDVKPRGSLEAIFSSLGLGFGLGSESIGLGLEGYCLGLGLGTYCLVNKSRL